MNEEIKEKDFNWVWKDSTKEEILKQFYFEHIDLRKAYKRIKELEEINKQHLELNGTLRERIDKAIEYINTYTDKLKTIRVPKIDFNYSDLLNILQDKEEV